jgi:hypothetical protein
MRVLAVFAFIALAGLTAFNALQVRELKQEIAQLQLEMRHNEESRLSDAIMSEAVVGLMKARSAMSNVDVTKARATLDDVSVKLQDAAKMAGDKSKPALDWLRNESAAVAKDLQNKIGGR